MPPASALCVWETSAAFVLAAMGMKYVAAYAMAYVAGKESAAGRLPIDRLKHRNFVELLSEFKIPFIRSSIRMPSEFTGNQILNQESSSVLQVDVAPIVISFSISTS